MDPLLDPLSDRVMKDIIPPPHRPISDEILYTVKSTEGILTHTDSVTPNWEQLKSHMYREGRVSKEHCHRILRDTLAIISKITVMISIV